ncbi:hypothetical protein GN244_ATG00749 [Phytophthora infestans]|uniref:RxLR effector protein n=1 Tax=Phytophthora infestans TaxID=4787 RepID=A0A833X2L1_PHYIN|nr:hypothetical protein GN244_ATG00749 [Phytophthora infestans]
MTYVKKFDEKYPRQQKPAIDLYTSAFGDTAVLTKLNVAVENPATRDLVKVMGANPSVVKTLTETVGGKRMLAKILESTGATTSQKKQFASWMDDGVSPKDLMTKIYKESAASASVEENKVVDKLTAFYRSQKAGD